MALIPTLAPEDYKRRMAYKLMQEGSSGEPVQHWAQGLARMAQGALGGYQMYQADEKDAAAKRDRIAAYLSMAETADAPTPSAPQATPATPSAPPMPTPAKPLPQAPGPMVGADPQAVAGPRPGGPVQPTAKVWGDAEAEAAGLYEPAPKNVKMASALAQDPAALPPAAQPAQGYAIPGQPQAVTQAAARPPADPRIIKLLRGTPAQQEMGVSLIDQQIAQQFKPAEWDFKERPDGSLVAINKRDPNNVRAVPAPGGGQAAIDYKASEAAAKEAATTAARMKSTRATEEGMPASTETTSKLRNEIQGLPSYKNIAQAAPVYKSMLEAAGRDTRAADVNMIYGMAKIMDPGSVVRESEMTVAQAIATLPQQLQAAIKSQMTGDGRLTPEIRAAIMQEAQSRIGAYQSMFDQDAGMYRGIAQRGRMNEADVLPSFGPFESYKPAAPPPKTAAPPAAGPKKTKSGVSWSVE